MTVKQYLGQIQRLDMMINHRIEQAEDLRRKAFALRSPELKSDKVLTSPAGDQLADAIAKYVDKQRQIDAMIDHYTDLKNEIIGQIDALEDKRYVRILHMKYVQYMSLSEIAEAIPYEYYYACRLHGRALRALERQVKDIVSIKSR